MQHPSQKDLDQQVSSESKLEASPDRPEQSPKKKQKTEDQTQDTQKIKENPKFSQENFQNIEKEMNIWLKNVKDEIEDRKVKFLHILAEQKLSKEIRFEEESKFDQKERKIFGDNFRKTELQLYQKISKDITLKDIWEYKMKIKVQSLQNITTLEWKKKFEKDVKN